MSAGYEAMTMSDVADAAGVGKGTVYLYFNSKAELLQGLRERYWAELLDVARRAAVRRASTPARRIARLFEDLIACGVRADTLFHAIYTDIPTTDIRPLEELTGIIMELLREGQAAGSFDVIDVETSARMMVGAYHGFGAWILDASPRDRSVRARLMLTHFDRLIGAG